MSLTDYPYYQVDYSIVNNFQLQFESEFYSEILIENSHTSTDI